MFTDSDNFGVNFPIDLDVKVWYQLTYNMIDDWLFVSGESHSPRCHILDWFYVLWEAEQQLIFFTDFFVNKLKTFVSAESRGYTIITCHQFLFSNKQYF